MIHQTGCPQTLVGGSAHGPCLCLDPKADALYTRPPVNAHSLTIRMQTPFPPSTIRRRKPAPPVDKRLFIMERRRAASGDLMDAGKKWGEAFDWLTAHGDAYGLHRTLIDADGTARYLAGIAAEQAATVTA